MILLPTSPLPTAATERPLDYGTWQTPISGGTITRLDRPGNRTAMDFKTPNLKPDPDARVWASRLRQAIGKLVRVPFAQSWRDPASPSIGACVVDGAGQGGLALAVRGAVPGIAIVEGQAFNIYDPAGQAYVHFATADAVIAATGKATIALTPMLRTSPADGSSVNVDAPVIDGQLSGNEKGWTQVRAWTQGLEFTVSEVR